MTEGERERERKREERKVTATASERVIKYNLPAKLFHNSWV